MAKINVTSTKEIRDMFKSWNSEAMQKRLADFPDSIVVWPMDHEPRIIGIYDDIPSARAELGSSMENNWGLTPLRVWFC